MTDEERLHFCEALAEVSYAKMYDDINATDAAARYSDAKEALHDAIGLARRLGQTEASQRLETRLEHVKSVFRSQFS